MKSIRLKQKTLKRPISGASKLFTLVEKKHIQAHLALTELRLRLRTSASGRTLENRRAALDVLHSYWREGLFPANTMKTDVRTPVFIDDRGVHCAVGYLMQQTGHASLARQINTADRFVLVEQLDNPQAEEWLTEYGFRREEAALVQPSYGGFVIERVSYTAQDKLFAALSLLGSLALLSVIFVALRIMRSKTMPQPKKRNNFFKLAAVTVVLFASFAFALPDPSQAVAALSSGSVTKETVTCEGWNTGQEKRPDVCNEFVDNGYKLPGWQLGPCVDFCIE